jgi:hypothetical protein
LVLGTRRDPAVISRDRRRAARRRIVAAATAVVQGCAAAGSYWASEAVTTAIAMEAQRRAVIRLFCRHSHSIVAGGLLDTS